MVGGARLVSRRAVGHVTVLLTATLAALVAGVLLVSATVLAPGTAERALQRTLITAEGHETTLTASTGLDDRWTELDRHVRESSEASGGLISSVTATVLSTAYTVPALGEDVRIAVGGVESADSHAALIDGRWPGAGADALEAVVHVDALEALGVEVGDTVGIDGLTGGRTHSELTIVGSYRPDVADSPVWHGYGDGVRPPAGSSEFTVVGPVLVDPVDMLEQLSPATATAAWILPVDVESITLDDAGAAAGTVRALATGLSEARAGDSGQQMSVLGEAGDLIDRARESAASARALLLVVVVMLGVLGTWTLAFTARLVAVRRAPATALLRARGADEKRLLRWSAGGTFLPALFVAAASPPLAAAAMRGQAGGSALAMPGWLAALGVATLWSVLMVAADLRAGRSITGVAAETARPRRAMAQRAGLDVLLLAVGVVGLQQLRRPPEDAPEIVLVVAPSLVVLAGTVMLIRLLPWTAAAVAKAVSAATGAGAMLGALETSRRAARHVGAAVLLILAITVAVFAANTQDTWRHFSAATVDLAEPADVRVEARFSSGGDPDELAAAFTALTGAIGDLPAVEASMPVVRVIYGSGDDTVEVIGLDPDAAPATARWSDEHAGGDMSERLASLTEHGEAGPSVLATPGFAEHFGLSIGDPVDLPVAGPTPVTVVLRGVVDAVPGSEEERAVLIDSSRLTRQLPDEWWVATSDDGAAAAAAALDLPAVVAATTHADLARSTADDPSSAGVATGLTAGLVFAAIFVLIGVVVHAVTSLQARIGEYAVLRAIGLGRRGVAGAAAIENGVLLGFSTIAGLALGLLVASLVVPHTVGGLAGLPAVPPLHLQIPWEIVVPLGAAVLALGALLVGVQTVLARRIDVPGVLRAGEDT